MKRILITIIFISFLLVPSLVSARDVWQIQFFDKGQTWEFSFDRKNFDFPDGLFRSWARISDDRGYSFHICTLDLSRNRWSLNDGGAWMNIDPESAIGRLQMLLMDTKDKLLIELADEKQGIEEIHILGPIPTNWITGNPLTWFFIGEDSYSHAFSEIVGTRDRK